jgi:hypothetical protein
VLFYTVAVPHLEKDAKIAMAVIYSTTLVVLVLSTTFCSLTDPSDPVMVAYRN